jgi:hypothetical protein
VTSSLALVLLQRGGHNARPFRYAVNQVIVWAKQRAIRAVDVDKHGCVLQGSTVNVKAARINPLATTAGNGFDKVMGSAVSVADIADDYADGHLLN